MKRFATIAALALLLAGCRPAPEVKVMARAVPERADDFVFENNLVAGRFYGEALEGNPTSPGLDIWVKLPGALVADEWYRGAMEDPDYYHHDHGGKDCYKVAVSLGGGASVPYVEGRLCFPATNYRSSRVDSLTPGMLRFTLNYPAWEIAPGVEVALEKTVTVTADTYFCDVEDVYTFTGADSLTVAAGFNRHLAQNTIELEQVSDDRYAIWEHASDQSIEPEEGMLGVAVVMPGSEAVCMSADSTHALLLKSVTSGEPVCYKFGSCWSKGDIKTAEDWFKTVEGE